MKISKALSLLRRHARSRGIAVKFLSRPGFEGSYSAIRRTLFLSPKLRRRPRRMMLTFAHELGHARDFDRLSARDLKDVLVAVGVFNYWHSGEIALKRRDQRLLRQIIIWTEHNAYLMGLKTMRELGIPITRHFNENMAEGLLAYELLFAERKMSFTSRKKRRTID